MIGVLLDTSAYSALGRGHSGIVERIREVDRIVVNPVLIGELRAGFRKGSRRRKNEEELERFLATPRVETLGIDAETAKRYAAILEDLWRAGTPIPTNDVWIASSAMQHGLSLLTTDGHYRHVKQILVEYFDA